MLTRLRQSTYLFEEHLVAGLLLHLTLGPFLSSIKTRVKVSLCARPRRSLAPMDTRQTTSSSPSRTAPRHPHARNPREKYTSNTPPHLRPHRPHARARASQRIHIIRDRNRVRLDARATHRHPSSIVAYLGLLLTAGHSLGGLGGLRFRGFRRHLGSSPRSRVYEREGARAARRRSRVDAGGVRTSGSVPRMSEHRIDPSTVRDPARRVWGVRVCACTHILCVL